MSVFENFIPTTYNSLTIADKKQAIIDCFHFIFDSLQLEYIPIYFDDIEEKKDVLTAGRHMQSNQTKSSCFISINKYFLDEPNNSKNVFHNYIYKPYFLLHTIAHESFHHHQYTLVNKLLNDEPLSLEDKNNAYLYFVCLYHKLFSTLNESLHFSSECPLKNEDLYRYSPIEIQANNYGDSITDILINFDDINNFNYYKNTYMTQKINDMSYNKKNGGNLIVSSIEYQLQLSLDFLNYKNNTSGLKAKYLGIDTIELEKAVKTTIAKWKKAQNRQNFILDKIFKK